MIDFKNDEKRLKNWIVKILKENNVENHRKHGFV